MPRGIDRLDDARLQGRLWTPAVLSSTVVAAWYDVGDPSTISIASGVVTQLRDKSGNARNLSGGSLVYSTSALSFSPGITGARPGIIYPGSGSPLITSVTGTGTIISGFAVAQFNVSQTYARIFSLQGTSGGADFTGGNGVDLLGSASTGNTGLLCYDNANVGSVTFRDTTLRQPHVMVSYNDGVNNTMYADGSPGTPVAYAPPAKTSYIAIGASTAGADGCLNGVFSEGLVTYGNVSQYRQKIEGYLAWKWGAVDQLIASHPYKNRPPLIGE